MKNSILILFILFFQTNIFAQKLYPKDYFQSPLDIPLLLSANFAELRSNHFHGGIDFKTKAVEGHNIRAVADGYISRIRISQTGYGNALYITHTNGYVTVYAHIQKFRKDIQTEARKAQYDSTSFVIDYFPDSTKFPVKKGEIIALSGNSGSSGGPHLHFEIRDVDGETQLNPLFFNFNVVDNIKPTIYNLKIYPIDYNSLVNGKNTEIIVPVIKSANGYVLKTTTPIVLSGTIGFAIQANDFLNNSSKTCGIYSLEIQHNTKSIFSFKLDEINVNHSKYINAHMDFLEHGKKKDFHRAFRLPNNQLAIYSDTLVNNGVINFDNDTTHKIKIIVKDVYQNASELNFQVKSKKNNKKIDKKYSPNYKQTMPCGIENTFADGDEFKILLPETALYDTLDFEYFKSAKLPNSLSPVYNVHKNSTPIHGKFTISIKADSIVEKFKEKAFIATYTKTYISAVGGKLIDGYMIAKDNEFGKFFIMIDTIKPKIKLLNTSLVNQKSISFAISDNLSGIETYNGYVDDKWVLFEFQPKLGKITYYFDETRIDKGKNHKFELYVTDLKGNEAEFCTEFFF